MDDWESMSDKEVEDIKITKKAEYSDEENDIKTKEDEASLKKTKVF